MNFQCLLYFIINLSRLYINHKINLYIIQIKNINSINNIFAQKEIQKIILHLDKLKNLILFNGKR